MKRITLIITSLAVAALFGAIFFNIFYENKSVDKLENMHATLFSEPRTFPTFTLTSTTETIFTQDNLKNRWSLIFFGFTHCSSICPTTLAELSKVYKSFSDLPLNKQPQIIFVTVDPEHDSRESLQAYLNTFSPAFIGLTSNTDTLSALRTQLGILALKNEKQGNTAKQEDEIDHSGSILIVNPAGHYYGIFTMPHSAEEITADMRKLIN